MPLINPKTLVCNDLWSSGISYTGFRCFTGFGIPVKPDSSQRDKDGFRILKIPGHHKVVDDRPPRFVFPRQFLPPRERLMPVDQDWTDVWPTAASFKPSVVPLPIRQGFIKNAGENQGITPGKYCNLELMKIPNFLHLTPKHIKKHCAAIQKFCTPWPKELNNNKTVEDNFPITISTFDYLYSGPSIRDPRSRKVVMKFKIDSLDLDYHAKDKMIRLLGPDRYDSRTGEVTITTDCCPLKQQNTDYAKYILTALYYESWKVEDWESEKTWADLETYVWEKSHNKDKVESLVSKLPHANDAGWRKESIEKYGQAVTKLHNEGESSETLAEYKDAVLDMLQLKTNKS